MGVKYLFPLIALLLVALSVREYYAKGKTWNTRSRTWIRIALIFGAVSAWLWLAL